MKRFAGTLLPLVLGASLSAFAGPGADPLAWLQKAASAARTTNYAGTVVHVSGERTATSRITHIFVDGSEHEKIEALDGPRREIVRHNEDLQCYYPDAKTIRVDRRVSARFFPAILSGPPEALAEHYRLQMGKIERVLGRDCQWIHLDPKDALRYAQRVCAEVGSGLLMRARTLGAKQQVLEQYAFTDLRLGSQVSRNELKGTFESQSKDWRRDGQPLEEAKPVATGWTVFMRPAGFRQVIEMQRKLPNREQQVAQLVFSDGLATMSVFVEPMSNAPNTTEALSEEGAISVFVRPMGEHIVTVLGEVPPAAAQYAGRSVTRQPASNRVLEQSGFRRPEQQPLPQPQSSAASAK
jgi:sigma-E factor negative regulatory protein RseB